MTIKVTYNITDVYVTQDVSPVYINVSYSSGGGSGAAVWGSITGTISDQTDLQTALDGKFDDPTGTSSQYIDGTGALQTFPMTLPVLQEVRNQTGATLDAGTVVYINGATGNKPTVTKAIATGDATSAQTLGMVSAAIANNGTGYVVVIGTCSGLDTSAFTEGQQLYLSYTTAGAVTTTKPYAPYHLVYVGIVTRSHPTLGTIEVRVQNGFEVAELHDVSAQNPNNNDGLFYNSTTSLWEHKQISTALGYTPANAATTLTINGVTYDLSTSRTWTISAGISGSGASGQVAYWTGASAQSGSNNLFWDNTNGRLGIGTIVPNSTLTISGNLNISGGTQDYIFSKRSNTLLTIQSQNSGANSQVEYYAKDGDGTDDVGFAVFPLGIPTDITNFEQFRYFYSQSLASYIIGTNRGGTGSFRDIRIGNTLTPTDLVIKATTGNILINSTSDSGQRLQVQGTTLLNGNVTFSSSTGMFWDATNNRLGIGTNVPANALTIFTNNASAAPIQLRNTNASGFSTFYISTQSGADAAGFGYINNGNATANLADRFVFYTFNNRSISFTRDSAFAPNLFIQGTNGNVLINSQTDTGERLQVTGTMKVTGASSFGGNMTLEINQNASTLLTIRNSTSGTSASPILNLSGSNGNFQFVKRSSLSTAFKFFAINDAAIFNDAGGDIGILNDNASGTIKFAAGGSSTAHMTIKSNGRINMSSLPTSSTGLATGDLWNDAGTLKIV